MQYIHNIGYYVCSGIELPPVGFELGTFGLQQRSESDTLATAPARHNFRSWTCS